MGRDHDGLLAHGCFRLQHTKEERVIPPLGRVEVVVSDWLGGEERRGGGRFPSCSPVPFYEVAYLW